MNWLIDIGWLVDCLINFNWNRKIYGYHLNSLDLSDETPMIDIGILYQ